MSARLRTANVLAVLTTMLFAAPAWSQVTPSSAVVVTILPGGAAGGGGGSDSQSALEASLKELLARLHLAMNPAPGGVDPVVARVQIDLTSPAQAIVLVTDGRTGEVRARRIIPRDTSAAITREEIAHAVQSAVESSLIVEPPPAVPPPPATAVAPAPVAPPLAAAPAPVAAPVATVVPVEPPHREPAHDAPTPSASAHRRVALDLATLAGAGPFGSGVGPVVRVGGGVQLSSRGTLRPSIEVTGTYAVPFQSNASLVGSYTSLVSLRALAAIELLHASWFALDFGAGGGVDFLSVQPKSAILPTGNLGPTTTRADPIVMGTLTARAALAPSVVFFLAADVDVDLATRHYVLDEGASQVDVFDPWRVRPSVFAGLAFTAAGEGLFASRAVAEEAR